MPEKFRCLFEASPGFLDLLCLGNVTESHLLVIDRLTATWDFLAKTKRIIHLALFQQ